MWEYAEAAQLKKVDITNTRIKSYILTFDAHISSGVAKAFVEGEKLFDRPVVMKTFTRTEILESPRTAARSLRNQMRKKRRSNAKLCV
jgi:hypothetical protein